MTDPPTRSAVAAFAQAGVLVLSGECRLLVEGEERLLRAWDLFHCPAGTEHIFVGAGDGPCVILTVGARSEQEQLLYPRRVPRWRFEVSERGRTCVVTEILLFHHAQGQTRGFLEFADALRAAGHVVHAPDLYDGKTFTDLNEGVGYAREVGFGTIVERGRRAAEGLASELVYAGFSLGVMPAQMLAQTRPGAKGALLLSAALPASEFGGTWPPGVPLQIHMMENDEWAAEDLPAARELVETTEGAELFLYPGEGHLFADKSLSDYDESAATLLERRVLAFLEGVE